MKFILTSNNNKVMSVVWESGERKFEWIELQNDEVCNLGTKVQNKLMS